MYFSNAKQSNLTAPTFQYYAQNNAEEYNRLCNGMEHEINSLLDPGSPGKSSEGKVLNHINFLLYNLCQSIAIRFRPDSLGGKKSALPNIDIDEMYSNLRRLEEEGMGLQSNANEDFARLDMMKEDFWRDMEHSDDPFDTVCHFMSKGYTGNL